jgi:IPT/TIG domain
MATILRTRWVYTALLGGLVLVLALAGGPWSASQAAGAQAPQAVPTITSIDPDQIGAGQADFEMTITGSGFEDATRTGVRFYQWGTVFPVFWEFVPETITDDTITITIPARFIRFFNRFSVVVVNYTVPIATVPTVPVIIPDVPLVPYNPMVPPVIEEGALWEEISDESLIFTIGPNYIYLPVVLR